MLKVSIRYALACGIFLSGLFIVSFRFGSNPFTDFNHIFFDAFVIGLFVFFANYEFKKYRNNGILHFWQGMTLGFLVYIPALVIFMLFLFGNFYFNESLLLYYKESALKYLSDNSTMYIEEFGESQFESQKEAIIQITPQVLVFMTVVKKIVIGLFITPILSIFLRYKLN